MKNDDLRMRLDTVLDAGRRLYATAPKDDPEAEYAWHDLQRAYHDLASILDGDSVDRLFRRRDGRNPWDYPDRLGDRILWCLSQMGITTVGWIGNSVLIQPNDHRIARIWLIGDNGGELTCYALNDPKTMSLPGIACTGGHFVGYYTQPMRWAMTVAWWIKNRVEGGEVQYQTRAGDGERELFDRLEARYGG